MQTAQSPNIVFLSGDANFLSGESDRRFWPIELTPPPAPATLAAALQATADFLSGFEGCPDNGAFVAPLLERLRKIPFDDAQVLVLTTDPERRDRVASYNDDYCGHCSTPIAYWWRWNEGQDPRRTSLTRVGVDEAGNKWHCHGFAVVDDFGTLAQVRGAA